MRTGYAALTRLEDYASDDVLLHGANHTVEDGIPASARMRSWLASRPLLAAADGTLVMDVQHIVANDHFRRCLGRHADSPPARGRHTVSAACGSFKDGRPVQRWENAYDAPALIAALTPSNDTCTPAPRGAAAADGTDGTVCFLGLVCG